jgi:1,4-alpha-glucan branching enzyme
MRAAAPGAEARMPKKTPSKNGNSCKVTFELPGDVTAEEVVLVGDFNEWQGEPMPKRRDGRFSLTVTLPAGREYRYRYLLDGERWENDWAADAYAPNDYGSEDSILRL